MKIDDKFEAFLSAYPEQVFSNALRLREILSANLPDIIEQVDIPGQPSSAHMQGGS